MTHYRRCPNCGYVEPVAWRGSKWNVDWEIADFAEFTQAYPQLGAALAARLGEGYGVIEGDYYYWRQSGKSQHLVHRVPLVVYRANGNRPRGLGTYMESHRAIRRRRAVQGSARLPASAVKDEKEAKA